MKHFLFIIFFCCIFQTVFGQNGGSFPGLWEQYNTKYDNPHYVVDGKRIEDAKAKEILQTIDPYAIDRVYVSHGSELEKNTVYINTNTAKFEAVRKKLGAFSQAYADYLNSHQPGATSFLYCLNSEMLTGDRRDILLKLYNVPAENIRSVNFYLQQPANGDHNFATVRVITK